MTNSQSRVIDVRRVKERERLWIIISPQGKMLDKISSPSILTSLKLMGFIPTNWEYPAAASSHKKRATTGGGRKRLATEKRRFYLIGCAVDQQFRKFDPAFKLLRELKIVHGNDLSALRSELARRRFAPSEIDALLHARTPMGAAKRFVAQSLANAKHPTGLSLRTIHSCYSRYLKALKP